MELLAWVGEVADSSQAMMWPRTATYFSPKLRSYVSITNDTPEEVKEAQFLLAGEIAKEVGSESPRNLEEISVGSITLRMKGDLSANNSPLYKVSSVIRHLLISTGFPRGAYNPWWRAN